MKVGVELSHLVAHRLVYISCVCVGVCVCSSWILLLSTPFVSPLPSVCFQCPVVSLLCSMCVSCTQCVCVSHAQCVCVSCSQCVLYSPLFSSGVHCVLWAADSKNVQVTSETVWENPNPEEPASCPRTSTGLNWTQRVLILLQQPLIILILRNVLLCSFNPESDPTDSTGSASTH